MSKNVSNLLEALVKLSGAAASGGRTGRMTTQSIGSVPLLLHKKQSVVAQEARRVTKTEGMWRGAPSPSFAHSELFREKAAGPACFIANASVTSKGP